MTDDLVQFIRDRLDEDEQAARTTNGYSIETADGDFPGEKYLVLRGDHLDRFTAPLPTDLAAHIARHDPARVLAEVEAKRQLLDLHPITTVRQQYSEADLVEGVGPNYERRLKRPDEPYCETCDMYDGVIDGDGTPCPTLRLLALPFATHPDYREEWRP
ncbi:DUF6221 family protein [Streptomyces violascens]|uniref:DUF6221 family protein n=1 Tax=Streptomyces violascens TaxID=67381 RepID=UPI00367EF7F2